MTPDLCSDSRAELAEEEPEIKDDTDSEGSSLRHYTGTTQLTS